MLLRSFFFFEFPPYPTVSNFLLYFYAAKYWENYHLQIKIFIVIECHVKIIIECHIKIVIECHLSLELKKLYIYNS